MKQIHRAAEFLHCSVLELAGHPDRETFVRLASECAFIDALAAGICHDNEGMSWPDWYDPC